MARRPGVSFKFEGGRQIQAALGEIASFATRRSTARRALEKAAQPIRDEWERGADEDSGDLKKAIKIGKASRKDDRNGNRGDRVTAFVGNRPFAWHDRATCIHLARAQARAMGHRPPPIPDIRSAIGARRALKAMGHATLTDLLDVMFERIAPAAALPGDLVVVPGEEGFESIGIAAGGALLLYHADGEGLCNVKEALGCVTGAWRL